MLGTMTMQEHQIIINPIVLMKENKIHPIPSDSLHNPTKVLVHPLKQPYQQGSNEMRS